MSMTQSLYLPATFPDSGARPYRHACRRLMARFKARAADAAWRLGRADTALVRYAEAIRLDPAFAVAHNNRAVIHSQHGHYARALAGYDAAMRLNPLLADVYFNRGCLLEILGDDARAEADFDAALILAPRWAEALRRRAGVRRRLGRAEAARQDLDAVSALARQQDAVYDARGRVDRR